MDRRRFLQGAGIAGSAALGAGLFAGGEEIAGLAQQFAGEGNVTDSDIAQLRTVGETSTDDFDPYSYVREFNWGDEIEDLGDGRKRRIFRIDALDKEIEVAPGVTFPAWAYNGQVPGPTLRANEGDEIRVEFSNASEHPHTIHFHGIHRPEMDGVPGLGDGMIDTGDSTVYEFTAEPYGTHVYHCHSTPLKKHVHKGLYGMFIVDPPGGYDEALGEADHEFVMVMNAFDTDQDGDNEIYAVNTKAFCYAEKPLQVRQDDLVRVYLANATEFDAVNSFHLHAHFFDYYDTGRLENRRTWIDTVSQVQAQRGILQFRPPHEGKLMFHAHQSEFAELGWLSFFDVASDPSIDSSEGRARSSEKGPADSQYRDDETAGPDVADDVDDRTRRASHQVKREAGGSP
jgi:FtsP/CotA-like multicopper oxidase with cupredoxin domain